MRRLILAGMLAATLAACGDTPQSQEGTETMSELAAIRDVWNFSDPAASETAFRELAAQATEAGNDTYAAEAMTQVARTFSLRREMDQANAILNEIDTGAQGQVPVVRVRILLERGRTLNSSGQGDAALPLFEEAYHLAARHDEGFLAGDAIHMAGIAADIEGEQQWMGVLVQYIADHPGTPADYWLGPMHNNLGWSYFFADRFEEALPQMIASRAAYETQDGKRYEVLIADYAAGRVLRALDRCAEALPLQETAYAAMREEFDEDDQYIAEEIALCRAHLGDAEGAVGPATLAYGKFSEDSWFVENEAERLAALRALAGL